MTCSIEGCTNPVRARGWCRAHYLRWQRHGDPRGGRPEHWARQLEDVWEQVKCGGPDECWPWTGPTDEDGYGDMRLKGGLRRAHRIAFFAATNIEPGELVVRHTCDNPPCCNPAHLILGTAKDNNRDIHDRGRWCDRKGSRHPLAKLDEAAVEDIRRRVGAGERQSVLALEYGVVPSRISTLVRHPKTHWRHV